MLSRFLWLGLACGCTQDFDAFAPLDGADSGEGGSDVAMVDGTGDAPLPDVAVDAPPCATMIGTHCYFLLSDPQNQTTSASDCTSAGAHLVSITGSAEQTAVAGLGAGTERWIGLFRASGPPVDGSYAWSAGEPRAGFSAWSPGEPNGSGPCVRLLANGLWADQDCAQPLASVCERE